MAVGWAVNYSLTWLRCVSAAFCVSGKRFIQTLTFNSVKHISSAILRCSSAVRADPLHVYNICLGAGRTERHFLFQKKRNGRKKNSHYKLCYFGFRANQRQEAAQCGGDAGSRRAQNAHAHRHTHSHMQRGRIFF